MRHMRGTAVVVLLDSDDSNDVFSLETARSFGCRRYSLRKQIQVRIVAGGFMINMQFTGIRVALKTEMTTSLMDYANGSTYDAILGVSQRWYTSSHSNYMDQHRRITSRCFCHTGHHGKQHTCFLSARKPTSGTVEATVMDCLSGR